MSDWQIVSTEAEVAAVVQAGTPAIEVYGMLRGMPMLTLGPGVHLRGGVLEFGAKGIRLTHDNTVEDITIRTPDHEVAILNDTSVANLGVLSLRGVRTTGQVLLVARDAVWAGHVAVDGLTVESGDLRGRAERPHGFGVDALHGAFTLWNLQPDPAVIVTDELLDIAAGSPEQLPAGSTASRSADHIRDSGQGKRRGEHDGRGLLAVGMTLYDVHEDKVGKISDASLPHLWCDHRRLLTWRRK